MYDDDYLDDEEQTDINDIFEEDDGLDDFNLPEDEVFDEDTDSIPKVERTKESLEK